MRGLDRFVFFFVFQEMILAVFVLVVSLASSMSFRFRGSKDTDPSVIADAVLTFPDTLPIYSGPVTSGTDASCAGVFVQFTDVASVTASFSDGTPDLTISQIAANCGSAEPLSEVDADVCVNPDGYSFLNVVCTQDGFSEYLKQLSRVVVYVFSFIRSRSSEF